MTEQESLDEIYSLLYSMSFNCGAVAQMIGTHEECWGSARIPSNINRVIKAFAIQALNAPIPTVKDETNDQ